MTFDLPDDLLRLAMLPKKGRRYRRAVRRMKRKILVRVWEFTKAEILLRRLIALDGWVR